MQAALVELVDDAVGKGAKILVGGKKPEGPGFYYPATVLSNVPDSAKMLNEEIFGPVASLQTFKDEAEVIKRANDTEYGLAAYFYGRDVNRVWRMAEALEAGMVGINTGLISTEVAPFGGVKESGIGREGSKYGIEEFLEVKYLCMGDVTK